MGHDRRQQALGRVLTRLDGVPGARFAGQTAQRIGIRAGLLGYRPPSPETDYWVPTVTRDLEYIGGLQELCRYSLLVGYMVYFGGAPRILDIGCGKGHLRARMAGLEFTRYVGVDSSAVAIGAAQSLADDRTTFVQGDAESVDLTGFDVVVANEVLYYLADPGSFLCQLHAALAPEALLLTSMWRQGVDDYLWRLIEQRFERLDLVHVRNMASGITDRGWRVGCHRRP
jgi:SAM-dependent methyltransferase